ncbi:MAG: hypothetical protein HY329_28225 [Chloroflexi bacterium]|nr:hypothetical protein [Chloroflexota bacterium]
MMRAVIILLLGVCLACGPDDPAAAAPPRAKAASPAAPTVTMATADPAVRTGAARPTITTGTSSPTITTGTAGPTITTTAAAPDTHSTPATQPTRASVERQAGACYTPPMPISAIRRWFGSTPPKPVAELGIRPGTRSLALYYGWPSVVNGANGDVEVAAATFNRHGVVVFGDGLELPTHPDYQRTVAVLHRLRELGGARVFGYVDLGVRTQNLDLPTIVRYADAWRQIGVHGIFLDDAGADFGVDERRRDAALEGIRRLGLPVILNAHEPDDAFRGRVKLTPEDGYLLESFQVSNGLIQSPEALLRKADRALELALQSGTELYAVATGPSDDPAVKVKRDYAWWTALLYGIDYFQYTTIDYSARTAHLPEPAGEPPDLGTCYLEATVRHSWAEGLHRRLTDLGEIRVLTQPEPMGMFLRRGG